ncbi:hypothetical protein JHK82_051174 [Glycine max]|uniref:Soyasapogenol B glucuronide galactosyltransferase n=1 Tax=Glycine max TaxID=3847 RepID=A0A0R0FE13_SOYBN|nr:hypothetical protein JHK85_051878 [Glycine max]KAG5092396.1 hypothetical protein JHK82_051174 [Glycine max]KAG5095464.1 hypothetical protein JHK84_051052 [Glycine max]KAH1155405.1 hypothetical protein GYH30_050634 [Glycine max]
MSTLQGQIEFLFQDLHPDCLVTDVLYPWTVESAEKLGIARLYFYSSSYFASCATHFIRKHKPREKSRSYRTLYTSFHELEGDYEQLYHSTKAVKCWSVGPVSASANKSDEEKANRGHKEELALESEWLNWLNSKQIESIVEIAHGLENSYHSFIWVVRKKDEKENEDVLMRNLVQHNLKSSLQNLLIKKRSRSDTKL